MVGSNKRHGSRNNGRHQRGGILYCNNAADQVIYPYMHDEPFPPYKTLPKYNTRVFKIFVATNLARIRMFMCKDTPDYSIFTIKGESFIEFGKHLRSMCENLMQNQSGLDEQLPSGWVMTLDKHYVNIFTNTKQVDKPTKEVNDEVEAWSLSTIKKLEQQVMPAPGSAAIRPTLTADKRNITTNEKVTITPSYGNSATLMLSIYKPTRTIIANSDANESAEDVKNGLIKKTHGVEPFTYEKLPPGIYVLRLIGDDSSQSDPLMITVEEPNPNVGGKTRGHKRRACKRTRKH